jgi:hypothetical protein
MQKNPPNLGLFSELPKYTSEEALQRQLAQAPRLSGKSLATSLVRRTKETPDEQKSEPNPRD